jgi:hypothetical protein
MQHPKDAAHQAKLPCDVEKCFCVVSGVSPSYAYDFIGFVSYSFCLPSKDMESVSPGKTIHSSSKISIHCD